MDTWFEMEYYPFKIFLYSLGVSLSSKGRKPQTMANRMTPALQTSTIIG
jgi:sulfur relay (sulfurtransferase) complex TusBCD TusD component (DsrE family)